MFKRWVVKKGVHFFITTFFVFPFNTFENFDFSTIWENVQPLSGTTGLDTKKNFGLDIKKSGTGHRVRLWNGGAVPKIKTPQNSIFFVNSQWKLQTGFFKEENILSPKNVVSP